jgi:hypothetical protein
MNPYKPPRHDRPHDADTESPDAVGRPAWRIALALVLLVSSLSLLVGNGGIGGAVILAAGALAIYGRRPHARRK